MKLTSDLLVIDAVVRDVDETVGRGLFTEQPLITGALVAVFGGTAVPGSEFRELHPDVQEHSIQVADDVYLVPGPSLSPAAIVNHSCEPNLRLVGQITMVAARPIEPGEQLCYDYATTDSTAYDEFECHCGTPSCRGKVTGDDWMRPEIQSRYAGWFSPYLDDMIAGLRAAERDPSGGIVITA